MNPKQIIQVAAILGALAVGIGAFGAHGLEDILAKNGRTETFETAVKYHFYHAITLLLVGILSNSRVGYLRGMSFSAINLIIGIIIFSGSLYILSITNITWLGAITPIGGIAFILGWVGIFWTVTKR
ncbi:DUF423 domain-containing protein [Algoriphagus hitonicola]|uniref:Uncharacterized membrane protein YgdD, TMEM256/DUF423 family n=1 Tax=Algoriphagus hitonicola TaxID=435880 RepID=A0A1I2WXK9_9BACT|nr:DUF423 domain-containing protein [Algoriphagus hitonicola]SFH05166.1 Uncharacterized membrane protein YgdD, TMEM256/DUF423 family [Algoriphagus hitonicola]